MQVTIEQAQAVIARAESRARELGVPVIISVLDAGCHLKALYRMDHAPIGSIDIAIGKARTAALFSCNSEDVWEYCKPGAPAPGLEHSNGGLMPFAGGISLKAPDGSLIGAVGVSGGAVSQDREIAQAGAAAVLL
ncbi:heme-binding protein [Massilia sp. BSC265]|uniref:GlcG/HbpS family heme-binding protein n=1 Tax=Massilia sp. BSC265 TaxID=1549812 RepID=UPI0004E93908|nr:heme-binding protein [Massilia sp. BSC265]KFI05557.1 glycolate utilization protein [Massilia sp. BSC265]